MSIMNVMGLIFFDRILIFSSLILWFMGLLIIIGVSDKISLTSSSCSRNGRVNGGDL